MVLFSLFLRGLRVSVLSVSKAVRGSPLVLFFRPEAAFCLCRKAWPDSARAFALQGFRGFWRAALEVLAFAGRFRVILFMKLTI
jgi:hypothetical protein